MPTRMEALSEHGSQMPGAAEGDRPLSSTAMQGNLFAHQSIECLPLEDGDKQGNSGQVLNCIVCGKALPRHGRIVRNKTGKCWDCRRRATKNPVIPGSCPDCEGPKQPRSKTCLECYRKRMAKRNIVDAGKLASAREKLSKKAKRNQTKPAVKAKELFDFLGLEYEEEVPFGRYSVDFIMNGVAVEVSNRYWHSRPAQVERDEKKKTLLEKKGYKLIILWDDQMHMWWLELLQVLRLDLSPMYGT